MAKSKSVAILAEMGTGKTLITIALAGALYNNNKINKMLNISVLEMPADRCPENFEKIYSSDENAVFFSQDCFIKIKLFVI